MWQPMSQLGIPSSFRSPFPQPQPEQLQAELRSRIFCNEADNLLKISGKPEAGN